MSLRRVIAIVMVVLLMGCSFTSDLGSTRIPSVTTPGSATPEPSVTSSPMVIPPVPMSATRDLIKDGVKQIVRRMIETIDNRPTLRLGVSASKMILTVLEISRKSFTLCWCANQIVSAESGIQCLGQITFRPVDHPFGNISELFDTATRMGAASTEKVLQVVGQRSGEAYLAVITTPETRTMFFERDGIAVCNLGYTPVTNLTDGLATVITGSHAATQTGLGPSIGY